MLLSPRLQKLHVDSLVVHNWRVFLKTRPFVKQNAEFTNVSSFTSLLMCSTHFTLSCRILLFSLPTTNNFFKFVYSEMTRQSACRVLFRPPSLAIEGHQNLTHFNSRLLISRTFLPRAGSSCTLLCLYLVSCTQKMRWRAHSLADIVSPFLTILQFFSEPSNNWGTGLPCLCPLWIYCTGQQHTAYFHVCFPVFPPFVYDCCVMDHTYHSHVLSFHTCTITSPFLQNNDFPFFKRLPSPSRSHGMPPLAVDSHVSVSDCLH